MPYEKQPAAQTERQENRQGEVHHAMDAQDDTLDIIEDETPVAEQETGRQEAWKILVVDDDPEVHHATLFALEDTQLLGRPLAFRHAYSAEETEALLRTEPDVAVILLDVVMENEQAGLNLVRLIRQDLGLHDVRIVLRTGQPGYAPELSVIRDYDINDYKTKSELTRTRLVTTLTTALRSYEQIRTISASRRGLDLIVRSAADLFARRVLKGFAEGVLTQIAALLGLRPEGLLCAQHEPCASNAAPAVPDDELIIVAAAGRYAPCIDAPLDSLHDGHIVALIRRALNERCHQFGEDYTALFFPCPHGRDAAVFLETGVALSETDRTLLEVFCVNIAVGLENVGLFNDLNFYAYAAPLTRLPNRVAFVQAIDDALREQHDDRQSRSVVLLDIDGFSEINDALGHQQGDQLLLAVAQRLASLPEQVTVARVSGDVFALLGPSALLEPGRTLELFAQPFQLGETPFLVSCTLGVADLAEAGGSGLEAIKNTNIALNRAKAERRGGYHLYRSDMSSAARERLLLHSDLRAALDQQGLGLSLHFQPQLSMVDSHLTGAEALIRWQRTDGSRIPPDRFISLAERSGLIIPLGNWVVDQALAQLRRWEEQGILLPRMAINISLPQLRHPDFLPFLRDCLDHYRIDPQRIELEITESVAMQEVDLAREALARCKNRGLCIALDDFGTGFSSLAHLHRLPLDRLKIDRSFVGDLAAPQQQESAGSSIAEMIVRLGHTLSLAVIAEGVETPEQQTCLQNLGCDEAQGYLYGRPMPENEFVAWVAARR